MPGAAALKIVADDETGELESATILGQWGEVPEDFAETVRGGLAPTRRGAAFGVRRAPPELSPGRS